MVILPIGLCTVMLKSTTGFVGMLIFRHNVNNSENKH